MIGKAMSAICIAAALSGIGPAPAAAQTKVTIVTFSGATNLPVWVARERGFFAKEGLDVTQEITRSSTAAMKSLMAGKYQFASTALDNTIAINEGQGDVKFDNYDVTAILGIHSGMNKIVSRPEIKTFADVKGKAIASDALTSGYGLVLVKVLKNHGLIANRDYTAFAVGSTPKRIEAMKANKAVIAVIAPPQHLRLQREGFNILADATEAIGAYQGSAFVVRRSWAKANEKTVLAFLRAQIAATDYVFANKKDALEIMRKYTKGSSDADLEATYTEMVTSKGGLNRRGQMNMAGVKTLLALRNELSGSPKKLTDANRYIDLSYYQKAVAGK
jgi:ABC-type nitrate/sulfonate/bicarbonate transport system substrate-binding protein